MSACQGLYASSEQGHAPCLPPSVPLPASLLPAHATCWIGTSWSLGLMQSVAPSSLAMANLPGLVSMAKMRFAPRILAPWITDRPTAPSPNTATLEPPSTSQVFHTAPKPVATPQPSSEHVCSGALSLTLAHEISATTVYLVGG